MKAQLVPVDAGDGVSFSLVDVVCPGAEPWTFIALDRENPVRLLPVDERRLIVFGQDRTIAVYDVVNRQRIAQRRERDWPYWHHAFLSRDLRFLVLFGVHVHVVDVDTLAERSRVQARTQLIEGVSGNDGRLTFIAERRGGSDAAGYVYDVLSFDPLAVDPQPEILVTQHVQMRWKRIFCLSPCGRFALKPHIDTLFRAVGSRIPARGPWGGIGERVEHPDVADDGEVRLGLAYELWSLRDRRCLRRLVLQYQTLVRVTGGASPRTPKGPGDFLFDALVERWLEFETRHPGTGTRPTSEDTRYLAQFEERRRQHDDVDALLRQHAAAHPSVGWFENRASLEQTPAFVPELESLLHRFFVPGPPQKIEWEAEGGALAVTFGDWTCRRVTVDGAVGPLETAPTLEPAGEVSARANEVFRRTVVVVVTLPALDETCVAAAINELTGRVAVDLAAMTWNGALTVRFALPGRSLSEETFFAHVAEIGKGMIEPLRALITTWCTNACQLPGRFGGDFEISTGEWALGHAVLALASLDSDAYEILQPWFDLRDPEHEGFGANRVLPAIANTTRWASEGAIRFSLRWGLREGAQGQYRWDKAAALEQSRRLFSPAKFMDAVLEEALTVTKTHLPGRLNPDPRTKRKPDPLDWVTPVTSVLDPTHRWDAAVLAELERRRPVIAS